MTDTAVLGKRYEPSHLNVSHGPELRIKARWHRRQWNIDATVDGAGSSCLQRRRVRVGCAGAL